MNLSEQEILRFIEFLHEKNKTRDISQYSYVEEKLRELLPNSPAYRIVEYAKMQIGTTENPPGSNNTVYGKWFGLDGVPWCAIFVSYVFYMAGYRLPSKLGYSAGMAGCQTAVKWFKENGWEVPIPTPGAIAFFDWNKDGRFDHTGIVIEILPDYGFFTIEGNTSLQNNSNGGEVMKRGRSFSGLNYNVFFALHPDIREYNASLIKDHDGF